MRQINHVQCCTVWSDSLQYGIVAQGVHDCDWLMIRFIGFIHWASFSIDGQAVRDDGQLLSLASRISDHTREGWERRWKKTKQYHHRQTPRHNISWYQQTIRSIVSNRIISVDSKNTNCINYVSVPKKISKLPASHNTIPAQDNGVTREFTTCGRIDRLSKPTGV